MLQKIQHFIFPILIFLFQISTAQPFVDKDSIFKKSADENKAVLIIFSGSDWCKNCIQFEKGIMKDSSFQHFVRENILLINADFPQKKKLSSKLIQQNESLAEQYNPKGIFPMFVLVSPEKKSAVISFQHESVALFIEKLKASLASILP